MSALGLLAGAAVFRLAASRQPYRRAGLAIAARGVFTIVPREQLDAEKVFALLMDPVVDMAIAAEEGGDWTVLSSDQRTAIAKEIAELTAPLGAPLEQVDPAEIERLRQIEEAWHADQRHLHDQGFQSLDALTSAWAADRAAIVNKTAELETAQADHAVTLKRVAALEAELAAATKPAPAAKAKAKAAE